jgi:hypothetical protein
LLNYNVDIKRKIIHNIGEDIKTEIWAEITDKETCTTMNKRIWWKDDNGVQHDETPTLPAEVRNAVDNAWLEKKRKW